MISVAALRMQQFGVEFYQASLTAKDIDKLVRFEVLNYGEQPGTAGVRGSARQSKVRWDLLERRIASNEKAYQRQIIRKKIDELVDYYEQCRQARDLPSIPGAVIISCDETLKFEPLEENGALGILKVPEREGILRAIDGQHRLLALHAGMEHFGGESFTVPAVIFDRLPEDHVVQMFVTINAKHTRLNASHLVSLSGRQLYRDDNLAAAHDVVRALAEKEDSPLHGEIKLLGVGKGKVAQAPLAQELKTAVRPRVVRIRQEGRRVSRGCEAVFRQLLPAGRAGVRRRMERTEIQHQDRAGASRVHSRRARHRPPPRSAAADRADFRAIGRIIAPWGRRIGDLRFETDGAWKRSTVDQLTKELRLALQYPEGAMV